MSHQSSDAPHCINGTLTRRNFLRCSIAGIASLAISSLILRPCPVQAIQTPTGFRVSLLPPLYCIAYINPDLPSQANQEAIIARYPLTLVPQDMRTTHIKWRDRIKHLNPNILMLGYQQVITETAIPGPGHEVMQRVKDAWCVYPDGRTPVIKMARKFRLFDPRKVEWQEAFLEACRTTLQSYPYNGLFLDNCTVFEKANPLPAVKAEMRQALQNVLMRLRQEYPRVLLIGNSGHNWRGLNGEMNEGRLSRITELAPFEGHVKPAMDMYQSRLRHPNDIETVQKEMVLAHARGGLYGASVTYQRVLWFDLFDEVMAGYKT